MPLVSVIIPTHNRADMLANAIDSVLRQSFSDFEILIVDDNSNDHTHEVVNQIKDSRINYLKNHGNNGPSVARNIALKAARGEYIAFLDDDDEWMPNKLKKQLDALLSCSDQVCGIYSNRLMIDKKSGKTFSDNPGSKILKGNLLSQLMIKNPIHTSTLMVKKSYLDQTGFFDETMSYMEDRDLWIRLSLKWDFEYLNEPLTKAYFHGVQHLSNNLIGQTKGREILLNRYHDLFRKNRKSWSRLHICLGSQYCQISKMSQGRKNLLKGLLIYPFNIIGMFHFISSLFGSKFYNKSRIKYKVYQ